MVKHEYFAREIDLIQSEDYRMMMRYYFDECVPDYFFNVGASSSGMYHPVFSQGKGGLVRHTKAVVMFAEELLRMSSYAYMKDEYKDYVIMACLAHDTCKYGIDKYDKDAYKSHARNAALNFGCAWAEYMNYSCPDFLLNAIISHMGQWSEKEDRPFTSIDRCVHMADYIASRSFIDIPQIVEEYDRIAEIDEAENLPF